MRIAVPGALAAIAVVAAGCGTQTDAAADGKIPVVASTNVWGSVVQAVGGADVSVQSLINDPSADPHSYNDKPEDATLLANAKQVNAFSLAGHPEGENEHVWYEFAAVKKVADKVAAELGAIHPSNNAV